MKRLTIFLFFIMYGSWLFASEISLSMEQDNKIKIINGNHENIYTFPISINGYNVSCSGARMIIWGFPAKFNDNAPGENDYILFDLNKRKIIKHDLMSHGIFDAKFFHDTPLAYIGSFWGYIINTDSGEMERIDDDQLKNIDSLSEKCTKPADWSFNLLSTQK